MFRKIAKDKYFCGVDVGAQSIKVGLIKSRDNGTYQLLGVYQHNTFGYKDGCVSDLSDFAGCVSEAVRQLSQKVGGKVKEIVLGIDGQWVDARLAQTMIPLLDKGSRVITLRDMKKVNQQARILGIKMEEESLHDIPHIYQIDDVNTAINPLGLYGRKLGVQTLMLVVNSNKVRNITKVVHEAGFDISQVVLSSYAASEVTLDAEQKSKGTVLIDMGAQTTCILLFKDKGLKYFDKIPMGGDYFTQKIAEQIHVPFDLAEQIKRSYAVAVHAENYAKEEILIKKDNHYVPIKRELVIGAIEPAIQQLMETLGQKLNKSGLFDPFKNEIRLIGGGALLPGLMERLVDSTRCSVDLGKIHIDQEKRINHAALFASAVGLALIGYSRSKPEVFPSQGKEQLKEFVSRRARELYQEYF
jgi:cell division protein FtsA